MGAWHGGRRAVRRRVAARRGGRRARGVRRCAFGWGGSSPPPLTLTFTLAGGSPARGEGSVEERGGRPGGRIGAGRQAFWGDATLLRGVGLRAPTFFPLKPIPALPTILLLTVKSRASIFTPPARPRVPHTRDAPLEWLGGGGG